MIIKPKFGLYPRGIGSADMILKRLEHSQKQIEHLSAYFLSEVHKLR